MGRRYRRRARDDDNLVVDMAFAAFRSEVGGLLLTCVLLVVGMGLFAQDAALGGLVRLLGGVVLLLAAVVAIATAAGFLSRHGAEVVAVIGQLLALAGRGIVWVCRRVFSRWDRTEYTWPADDEAPVVVETIASTRVPLVAPAAKLRTAPSILSKGEMAFYLPLREIVAERFEIQIKPSLADVLQCRNHPRGRQIATMHVDFLLCNVHTLRPCLAIELDDRSHRRRHRVAADRWKAELLAERNIPLHRQPCAAAYDVQALRQTIDRLTA